MTRDELRSAITGPVAVGGGGSRRVSCSGVLNDLGDDHDQLPLLQHALMRTWEHWERPAPQRRRAARYLGLRGHRHVQERALNARRRGVPGDRAATEPAGIAEQMFKALTDTFSDQRGVRRPTSIAELAAICGVDQTEVIRVVEIFRRPGRSFLMPPSAVPLGARSIVDLSHESLMRCWTRLVAWAEQDRLSASFYVRLSQAAAWFEAGIGGLWRDPELELGAAMEDARTGRLAAWARRYDESFDRAMAFLDRSLDAGPPGSGAEREGQRKTRAVGRRIGRLLVLAGCRWSLLAYLPCAPNAAPKPTWRSRAKRWTSRSHRPTAIRR